MTARRLLVCGGRDPPPGARISVFAILDRIHRERGIAAIIQGTARGIDTMAAEWGWERGITVCSFPADWQAHGKRAGFIRNRRMLDEGKPDAVVAFPGGAGTAMMVQIAREAGVPVWQPFGP